MNNTDNFLEFETLAERIMVVPYVEDEFFDWMEENGYPHLKIENQVCLFINWKHHLLMDIENESVQSVNYNFSENFRSRFHLINNMLKFKL